MCEDKCPKCGGEVRTIFADGRHIWQCGTYDYDAYPVPGRVIMESHDCVRRQLAAAIRRADEEQLLHQQAWEELQAALRREVEVVAERDVAEEALQEIMSLSSVSDEEHLQGGCRAFLQEVHRVAERALADAGEEGKADVIHG